jgi:hypothetical protein
MCHSPGMSGAVWTGAEFPQARPAPPAPIPRAAPAGRSRSRQAVPLQHHWWHTLTADAASSVKAGLRVGFPKGQFARCPSHLSRFVADLGPVGARVSLRRNCLHVLRVPAWDKALARYERFRACLARGHGRPLPREGKAASRRRTSSLPVLR